MRSTGVLTGTLRADMGQSRAGCPVRVQSVRRVSAGDVVTVRMTRGHTVAELEHQAGAHQAANMRLHDVEITRDRADASRAALTQHTGRNRASGRLTSVRSAHHAAARI